MSVQPSCTRSSSAAPPAWLAVKFSSQRCCQPGVAIPANQSGSIGWLPRTSTEDGVRWNTYSSRASLARCGTHWTAVAPVPMMPTRLSASLSIGAPVVVAAGVVVVPPAGVERVAAERVDPGDPGQLRHAQRAGAEHHELGGQPVAAVGLDDPARTGLVPAQPGHLGLEQRVRVQAELPADALAVREDLRAVHVLLRRHVPGLFQQRQVDHRRRVALRARIAVPVPGAAEVAALLDDADVDAGLAAAGPPPPGRRTRRRRRPRSGGRSWAPVRSMACADRRGSARTRR